MTEFWVQIDETEDVAASFRHAIRSAQFVGEDRLAVKWVLLALHSALQGACVCHLTTTAAPLGAVTKRNATEWLLYFEKSRTDPRLTPPKTILMHLPDLLRAVRKPQSAGDGSNSMGAKIKDDELDWLCRIHNDLRSQLVHFEPRDWTIDLSGLWDITKLIARIIEEILVMGWAFRHQTPAQQKELKQSLETLSKLEWPR